MSAKCTGINCALRLDDGVIEVRLMPFQRLTATIDVSKIGSIELLRKSVMPPAVVGGLALLSNLIPGFFGDLLLPFVPGELRLFLQLGTLGIAALCLILLAMRWLFARLVVRPSDTRSITLRMVPTGSAKRFVETFQDRVSRSQRI